MTIVRFCVSPVAVVVTFASTAVAQEGLITKPSKYSVAETIDRLEAAVKQAGGFQIIARVDYQALAATQGGKIRPSQMLLFGRGGVLQPIFPSKPLVAIDLPLKALAWEDESGKVSLTYITGDFLKTRYAIEGRYDLIKRLNDVTHTLANKALE
jgi:uncharacterized protein (DUF302 family)